MFLLFTDIEFKKSEIDEDGEKIQWAHLDKENTNIVHVISSDSPSLFFLKLFKFSDRYIIFIALQMTRQKINKIYLS